MKWSSWPTYNMAHLWATWVFSTQIAVHLLPGWLCQPFCHKWNALHLCISHQWSHVNSMSHCCVVAGWNITHMYADILKAGIQPACGTFYRVFEDTFVLLSSGLSILSRSWHWHYSGSLLHMSCFLMVLWALGILIRLRQHNLFTLSSKYCKYWNTLCQQLWNCYESWWPL